MKRFEAGARAAIIVSNHYANINRVVRLRAKVSPDTWDVTCIGAPLKAYSPSGARIECKSLLIPQWKLHLLDETIDDVVVRDAVEYFLMPAR